jgi:hypothetical protein
MPTHADAEAVRRAAKAIFDKRVDAVVRIAEAHADMLAKQQEAAAAEREHAATWAAALREGWTEAELKGMDLIPPGRKPPGRPARRRTSHPASADSDADNTPREDRAPGAPGSDQDPDGA